MWARLMGYINGGMNAAPAPTGQVQPLPQGGNGPRSASFVLGNRPVAPQAPDPRQQAINDLRTQLNNGGASSADRQPTLGPNNPIAGAASLPVNLPPVAGGNIPIGGGPGNVMQSPTGPQNIPIGGGPGNTMEAPTGTPAATPRVAVRRRPAAAIPPTARAQVPPATKSPWITGTPQNQDVVGGALARGGGSRPMGMLDLSQLFNRQ